MTAAESLRSALETLPDDQREIIVLRHVGGLAPAEIAARLGRSESAVNGLHHRGRRALRDELSASARRRSRSPPEPARIAAARVTSISRSARVGSCPKRLSFEAHKRGGNTTTTRAWGSLLFELRMDSTGYFHACSLVSG